MDDHNRGLFYVLPKLSLVMLKKKNNFGGGIHYGYIYLLCT